MRLFFLGRVVQMVVMACAKALGQGPGVFREWPEGWR